MFSWESWVWDVEVDVRFEKRFILLLVVCGIAAVCMVVCVGCGISCEEVLVHFSVMVVGICV
jgi:hypothetical protein